jgi:2,4-dienoyl-CoA reductase-like NADH-dependent reductase (Old Yellow Enzyme family)
MQLAYGGTQTRYETENREIWGPSRVKHPKTDVVAKEMTQEDISNLIDAFANAALRAKKSGFDGIELHSAHGYLLSQFLSPNFNHRTDKYGGSLDNRMRIICEIYEQTRSLVGDDFLILIKINASDFTDGGFTYEECQYVCQRLAQVGFDAIELSGPTPPDAKKKDQSVLAKYAAHLASIINIPVISVGKHRDYNLMTQILNQSEIEYFSMSRPFIAEPDLVKRWMSGDNEESKCISCGQCYHPEGISCILK